MSDIKKININGTTYNIKDVYARDMVATEFSSSSTYNKGDCVMKDAVLYVCKTAITVAGAWDASKWELTTLGDELQNAGNVAGTVAPEFDSANAYAKNDLVVYDKKVYRAKETLTAGTAWDASKWQQTTIDEELKNERKLMADDYDGTKTYVANDLVLYNSELYRCIVPQTTASATMDADSWTKVTIASQIENRATKNDFNAVSAALGFEDLVLNKTDSGKALGADGNEVANVNCNVLVYEVRPNSVVYVHATADTAGVYQFSSSATVNAANRIGSTVTIDTNAAVKVPMNGFYLVVSQDKDNIENDVKYAGLNTAVEAVTSAEKNLESWESLSLLVREGAAHERYSIGDSLYTTWTDYSVTPNWTYEVQMDIVSFEDVELEDGDVVPGMTLQWHWATPYGVQFDNYEAFYYAENELPAGTYDITIGDSWSNAHAGDILEFTTTAVVPAGGVLAGLRGIDSSYGAITGWSTTKAETALFSVTPTVVTTASGTSLGTYTKAGNSSLNSMQEVAYGHNRYHVSAIRQWLNSDKDINEWWTAQDNYDMRPDQLFAKRGFEAGFDDHAFLGVLAYTKIKTAKNYVSDSSGSGSTQPEYDVSYDRFFLPSTRQIDGTNTTIGASYQDDEGEAWQYWIDRTGFTTPSNADNTNRIGYAINGKTSAMTVRLRSACRGIAYYSWGVYTSGYCYYAYAINAGRCCPACVIA